MKILSGEELPSLRRVDGSKIAVEDAAPAAIDGVGAASVEEGGPLLAHEVVAAREPRAREQGEHVDALHVFDRLPEVRRVVALVLE